MIGAKFSDISLSTDGGGVSAIAIPPFIVDIESKWEEQIIPVAEPIGDVGVSSGKHLEMR